MGKQISNIELVKLAKQVGGKNNRSEYEDPFLADAMDGLSMIDTVGIPSELNQFNSKGYIAFGVGVMLCVGISLFLNEAKPLPELASSELISTSVLVNRKHVFIPEKKTEVTPEIATKKQEVFTISKPVVKKNLKREMFEMETLITDAKLDDFFNETKLAIPKTKILSYYGFMIVDNSIFYNVNNPIVVDLSGVPAKYESIGVIESETQIHLTYRQFMKKTMEQVNLEHWSNAIKNLNYLLSKYPNDDNANFYLGLINKSNNKFDKAIHRFDLILQNKKTYFYYDALWLKAQVLEEQGYIKKAFKLYVEISTVDNFYKLKAKKKCLDRH